MFTLKVLARSISPSVFDALSAHTSTSGGSRHTEQKAETVMPCTWSPSRDVTIVTPLGQAPRTRRKVSPSTANYFTSTVTISLKRMRPEFAVNPPTGWMPWSVSTAP